MKKESGDDNVVNPASRPEIRLLEVPAPNVVLPLSINNTSNEGAIIALAEKSNNSEGYDSVKKNVEGSLTILKSLPILYIQMSDDEIHSVEKMIDCGTHETILTSSLFIKKSTPIHSDLLSAGSGLDLNISPTM